jgi:hypothetical protein
MCNFLGSKWQLGLISSLPHMSWLSIICGSLDISQSYRLPQPVTRRALPSFIYV